MPLTRPCPRPLWKRGAGDKAHDQDNIYKINNFALWLFTCSILFAKCEEHNEIQNREWS